MRSCKNSQSICLKTIIARCILAILTLSFFSASLLFLSSSPAYSEDLSDFLCELATKYYERGDYPNALHEFKKALMINPHNRTAQKYIAIISDLEEVVVEPSPYLPIESIPQEYRDKAIKNALDSFDEVIFVKEPYIQEETESQPPLIIIDSDDEQTFPQEELDKFDEVRVSREQTILEDVPKEPSIVISPVQDREIIVRSALDEFEARYGAEDIVDIVPEPEEIVEEEPEHEEAIYYPIEPEEEFPEEFVSTSYVEPSTDIEKPKGFKRLYLNVEVRASQPQTQISLQIDRDLIIIGSNIARFLVINPEILEIVRLRPDEIKLVAKKIGSTYVHIWDDEGRWTFIVQVSPFRSGRPTLAELYRQQAEEAGSLKFHYYNEWRSFYSGRRADNLTRDSLTLYQSLGLDMQTPYGDVDGRVQLNRLNEESELSFYTLGLTDGMVGPFKNFDLSALDYYIDFDNISFGGASLRGVRLDAEAFNEKVDYTVFWGKEKSGAFGPLAPGLEGSNKSYLKGINFGFNSPENLYQTLSYFAGYGSDRSSLLFQDAYDYTGELNLGDTKLFTNVGHDGYSLAYMLRGVYTVPKLQLAGEFRNIDDDFYSITGRPYASGEVGGLVSYRYAPSRDLDISGRLNVYRDTLFPNPQHKERYNADFDTAIRYTINPSTSMRLDYYNVHDTGTISPHKDESVGLSLYKTIDFIRPLSTFVNLRHQSSKNPSSTTLDYKNEKAGFGVRVGLTDTLNYYISKEFNWLEDYAGDVEKPHVFETGLDYNTQILDSPFYITSRLYFRDEENAASTRSFLAGEDNLEGQAELRYTPNEDFNCYANLRVNNYWAENADTTKRTEAEIRFGTQWTFDTGLKWNPIGSITGIVFKDLNSDGKRQADEIVMKDIKIFLGREKFDITDEEGAYIFKNIRARKAFVYLDTNTLPAGYVPTEEKSQEITIQNGKLINVDFGVIARSEIYGIVFKDLNSNGEFDAQDEGVRDAVLSLEDGLTTSTNARGQFYLREVAPGKHTLTLDINSLPINLIPLVPLFKEIEVFEGITYVHNIPLKETQD